jgi:hypothetical protein
MEAKELDDGIASGIGSGLAPLPENAAIVCIADVCPETTVPISIPTINVSATNNPAMVFSRRAQLTIFVTGSAISHYSYILSAAAPHANRTRLLNYNTRHYPKFSIAKVALKNTLAFRPGWHQEVKSLFLPVLDATGPGFVVKQC